LAALVVAGSISGWSPSSAWGVHLDERFFGGFTPEGPQSWLGSVATIWFGVVAGRIMLAYTDTARRIRLVAWAAVLLVSGYALATIVPINKPLWTPSYAVVGAGLAATVLLLMELAAPLTKPLRLLGINPIVTYLVGESVLWAVREHLWFPIRGNVEAVIGASWAALLYPAIALALCLAMCSYFARRNIRFSL
jgi:predicted acyltransferase